ncbi:hypothetical protein HAX54_040160, partial [Datura stramonium]|nr:hypothetical protein [Datura stramonium]
SIDMFEIDLGTTTFDNSPSSDLHRLVSGGPWNPLVTRRYVIDADSSSHDVLILIS